MESELNGNITFKISSKVNIFSMIDKIPKLGVLKESTAVNRMIITTIVSELAWNILKYAQQGEIRLCRSVLGSRVNIDIWAQDNGPGIVNVDVALQENYSSGGTLGLGLPAVKRMSDLFWIKSDVGQGTLVLARKCIKELKPNPGKMHYAVTSYSIIPKVNEAGGYEDGIKDAKDRMKYVALRKMEKDHLAKSKITKDIKKQHHLDMADKYLQQALDIAKKHNVVD